ncbi:hypothetical protein V8C44DRAFT_45862 [Trichoderma aethiopicum]
MMWWPRVASFAFAGILFSEHVLAYGVYISRPTIEEPVTVTSYVIIYDGTLTETTSEYGSTSTTETTTSTTTETSVTETETESSSRTTSASTSSTPTGLTAFFTLPIIRVTITPTISVSPTSSTLSTLSTTPSSTSALFTSSTSTVPDAKQTDYYTPSPGARSTHVSAAQIAGIAIGSGALFCLVAALFFFFGRRGGRRFAHDSDHRRRSMRDVGAGLGAMKTRFGGLWRKEKLGAKQQEQKHIEEAQGPAELPAEPAVELPAEIPDVVVLSGVEAGKGSMERQVGGFQRPVVKELDGAGVVSHKPMSPSPEQQKEEEQQQQQHPHERSREAETSLVPATSVENGGSTLPKYEEVDREARSRQVSRAAPESAYRPDKSWYES